METPNEKKAREIAKCCSVMPPTPITQADVLAMTTNTAMQAMQWKDKERKELCWLCLAFLLFQVSRIFIDYPFIFW